MIMPFEAYCAVLQPDRRSARRAAFHLAMGTVVALAALLPSRGWSADALSPAAQRGMVFVRTHCSHCHSIDKVSESPLKVAPPFRTLHLRYPVESLQESLAEGIVTGHPSMPEFRLDPGQVTDVITYLKSLE
jgi:mono/diheme cytochrome c family protein